MRWDSLAASGASMNGWLKYAAFMVMTCAVSQAFHVSSGVVGTIAANPVKNDGC